MSFLITRPKHEKVNHYFYHWGGLLVDEAKKRGFSIIDLEKEKANKKTTLSYISKQTPQIVVFNGHGNECCIAGHDDEILLDTTDDSSIFKDMTIYMRACSAGKVLGHHIIKHAKAFIGYSEPYQFWTDADSFHKPLTDPLARPFLETSNQVVLSLLKGKSPSEAHNDSLSVYNREINKLLISTNGDTYTVAALHWNMITQVCIEK